MEQLEAKDPEELLEPLVLQELVDSQEPRDLRETLDPLVLQDLLVTRVNQELQGMQDSRVVLGSLGQLVHWVSLVLRGRMVIGERRGQLDRQDLMVFPDLQVPLVSPEHKDVKVLQVIQDSQDQRGKQAAVDQQDNRELLDL
jgi:hypothetical protein